MTRRDFGTAAGSSRKAGGIFAMAQGHQVDPLAIMDAIAEGGADLGKKLMEVAVKPVVVAAKNTIAYAMGIHEFGGSINQFNSAAKREAGAPKHKNSPTGPKIPRKKGLGL